MSGPSNEVRGSANPRAAIAGPVLRIEHLSKTFSGQQALRDVSFAVRSGEVLALCGENGSGKSTLIKILAGFHSPDPGSVSWLDGEEVDLSEPSRGDGGWRQRLHFIHQDLALVDGLSAVENMALGRGYETAWGGRINWREERRRAAALLGEFGASFDVLAPVGTLRAAERALIAIVRALQNWDPKVWNVLFLDEPTAALPAHEVEVLFEAMRRVSARGAGVVFVSHRLSEVFSLASRVTVLRNGGLVGSRDVTDLTHDGLVQMIVGRSVDRHPPAAVAGRREAICEVERLTKDTVRDVSFRLYAGEVLGVAGLTGSGREELPLLLAGVVPPSAGSVVLHGQGVDLSGVRGALDAHIALVPADRLKLGTIPGQTVCGNVTLPLLAPLFRRGRLRAEQERREVRRWLVNLDVRPVDTEAKLQNLSGGNQQKVVLAKWLRTEPRLLVLDQPTQGVDVGSRSQIYGLLTETARAGVGVIVCSAEAAELETVCDRVLVLRDGGIVAELTGGALTEDRIVAESLGSTSTDATGTTHEDRHQPIATG